MHCQRPLSEEFRQNRSPVKVGGGQPAQKKAFLFIWVLGFYGSTNIFPASAGFHVSNSTVYSKILFLPKEKTASKSSTTSGFEPIPLRFNPLGGYKLCSYRGDLVGTPYVARNLVPPALQTLFWPPPEPGMQRISLHLHLHLFAL